MERTLGVFESWGNWSVEHRLKIRSGGNWMAVLQGKDARNSEHSLKEINIVGH